MAIGDLLHQTPVTTPDPYTGCPVTRLTPPDHTSHHMYFYNRMVTSDSSRLLYCAEINGRRNLYLMELATGDAVQLTEGDALDDYGAMISADDKSVYYQQDRKVWKLDLATLQRTCLYAAPDGWDCGNWGMSEWLLRCRGEEYDTRVALHRHMHFFFCKEYRQPDCQVQTAIAIWLGV